ncbi:Glycosyltransferase involved in cell wall bisynthesis [Mariniphaga anaerophila]|uniref:Glycosyltransferase involved in cell wall bisynthesis n=1 Tax=Mariniphaga anaerophila TaxID=1484053 RepID=A0A1M5BLS6_9BACT|nr:glycosyltransferase family 2 protein [Mariniphaga anaerophila]SHF43172.1 Glycosyltransferase involved in cell wall bisynthesis [Mariniphaga anaerophila]
MDKSIQKKPHTNLVTIAMPCFERSEYFTEALKSAINQTVKCKIIVIDNCSSHDFFKKKCKEYNIKYFRNTSNIGLYPNINKCFELAETEYVKILGDDDILSDTYIESFVEAQKQYPEIDVYFSDYVLLTLNKTKNHRNMLPFGYMKNGNKIIEYGVKYNLGFPYMSSTIKKNKAKISYQHSNWIAGYDWIWVYSNADRLMFYGDTKQLYKFRIHKNQTHRRDWTAHTLTVPYIYDKILKKKKNISTLTREIDKHIFRNLVFIKAFDKNNDLKKIISSNDEFGEFLNSKLKEKKSLKKIYYMPRSLAKLIFTFLRLNTKLNQLKKPY